MRDALEDFLASSGKRIPRRDELGRRIRDAFADQRTRVEQKIEACMRADPLGAGDDEASLSVPLLRLGDAITETGHETPTKKEHPGSGRTPMPTTPTPRAAAPEVPVDPQKPRAGKRPLLFVAAGVLALAVVAALAIWRRPSPPREHDVVAGAEAGGSAAPVAGAIVLRLRGSNTVGAELAPALVEAFLQHEGATTVSRVKGEGTHSIRIVAQIPGKSGPQSIAVEAEGSATAFEGLESGGCDIGMSSRPIKSDEAARLAGKGFGDMLAPASEHVVALDGIAVVVHPNSPLRHATRAELASVFSGETSDWSALGAPLGPIAIYARDDASGTFDTFKHLVLGEKKLAPTAQRFADSDRLSDAVATDPRAIGFIGLAYVRNAKSLAIGDEGAAPMFPSAFTVTTEGYLLSRRLYLYTSSHPSNPMTLSFVNFALSAAGQRIVRSSGFVDLNVELEDAESCAGRCSARYASLVKKARRVSLDFRFRPGGVDLDSRGTRDIDRLLLFLRGHAGGRLMLLGFSDGAGDSAENILLSRTRAQRVASELEARGVHAAVVEGLGPDMPIASNGNEAGRERNRRVEVWLDGG